MKKIYLLLSLILFSAQSFAGSCPDGSDPIKSVSDDGTYYVYKCGGGSSNNNNSTAENSSNTASSVKGSKIEIYDVVFSANTKEELLNRIVSKLDYDFSKHKLMTNIKDSNCTFVINRIAYDKSATGEIQSWALATGSVNIKDGNIDFVNASWRQGGLSLDPSYFRNETNVKLTADGYFVGKMAYFTHSVSKGEVPKNPLYVTLNKHQRSSAATFKDNKIIKARTRYFIDIEDWAGGILTISNCKDGIITPKKPKIVKKEVKKVVTEEKSTESKKVTPSTQTSTSDTDPVISKVVEVTHGDKLVVNIAEPHELADNYIKISLKDIDAPDATKSCPKQIEFGVKVRDYVSNRLSEASSIKLTNIRKTNTKLIAQVIVDGKDLGGELVAMGYASEEYGFWKPYYCSALTAVQSGQQLYNENPEMALFWLERSLVLDPEGSNNTKSTYLLSELYSLMGDEKKSLDYLKQSASIGWLQAMEKLGGLYLNGIGVKQDKNQAKKWLKKAHEKGSQNAEFLYCSSLPKAKQNSCKF
ncbi:thermonuclease family protein [Candidatus Thioglobus sp.]|nr:thermonuclease family protein [Candidatus Thioglobus sp.]